PRASLEYVATKNALYNYSNYQTTVSLPASKDDPRYKAIDLSLFQDGIHHWMKKYGRDRNDQRYAPEQIVEIAGNMLQFQNKDGGWPKDLDWTAAIPFEEVVALRDEFSLKRSTFDNRSTYPQVAYLAKVYQQTGDERYRSAAERGLDYILK